MDRRRPPPPPSPPPPPRAFKEANVLLSGRIILSSFFTDALEEKRGASRERKNMPPLAPNASDDALIFSPSF